MDLNEILNWIERFQGLILGVPAVLGILGHLWHNLRTWAKGLADAREAGFLEAARYLWVLGQQIKARLAASGKTNADLLPELRTLAPGVLIQFGLASGASREDVEKLLELARMVHKTSKLDRAALPATIAEVLPPDPPPAPGSSATEPGASSKPTADAES